MFTLVKELGKPKEEGEKKVAVAVAVAVVAAVAVEVSSPPQGREDSEAGAPQCAAGGEGGQALPHCGRLAVQPIRNL